MTNSDAALPGHVSDVARDVLIIGAGPAGLTAAFQLHKSGVSSTILEADDQVGGISRTVERDGYRFDIGGHRFFTKVKPVDDLWHEILPDEDFLMRPRKSRIYYDGKYFDYPIKASNALRNLGPGRGRALRGLLRRRAGAARRRTRRTTRAGSSPASAGASTAPSSRPTPRSSGASRSAQMPADWAAQRVKGLSLGNAIVNAAHAQQEPEGDHLPHRGVPVPQVRARDDVGGLPRQGRGQGVQGRHGDARSPGSATRAAGPSRSRPSAPAAAPPATPSPTSSRPCRSASSSRPWTRPRPPRCWRRRLGLRYRDYLIVALVVPADRRCRGTTTGSTSTPPRSAPCASRTSGRGRPIMVKDGKNVLGLEYTVWEGDKRLERPRRAAHRASQAGARRPGPREVLRHRGRLRGAPAEGLPDLRRALPAPTSRSSGAGSTRTCPTCTPSGATACSATTTRTTRCSRPCSRSRTSSTGTTTTCGRSTSRRSTTRRPRHPRPPSGPRRCHGHRPRRPGPPPCGRRGQPLSPQRLTPPARPRRPPPAGRGASR